MYYSSVHLASLLSKSRQFNNFKAATMCAANQSDLFVSLVKQLDDMITTLYQCINLRKG